MALTELQREICRLIAENRIAIGESDVARGAALNELMAASRISRDIGLFHDTEEKHCAVADLPIWAGHAESPEADLHVRE